MTVFCKACRKELDDSNGEIAYLHRNYVTSAYHPKCLHDKEVKQFKRIISKVYGAAKVKFETIPNGYCSCENCSKYVPWFIFNTPDGKIKIGWRKRVINIEWLEDYKPFSCNFNTLSCTRGFGYLGNHERFIHANDESEAIKFLLAAKNSI